MARIAHLLLLALALSALSSPRLALGVDLSPAAPHARAGRAEHTYPYAWSGTHPPHAHASGTAPPPHHSTPHPHHDGGEEAHVDAAYDSSPTAPGVDIGTPHTPAAVCDTTQFTEQLPEFLPSLIPCIAVSSTSKQCCDAIANAVGSDEDASLPACLCNRDTYVLTEQLLEDTFEMDLKGMLTACEEMHDVSVPYECEDVDFASKTTRVGGRRRRRRRVREDDTWVRERSRRNTGRA